jgi:hypothetical protein
MESGILAAGTIFMNSQPGRQGNACHQMKLAADLTPDATYPLSWRIAVAVKTLDARLLHRPLPCSRRNTQTTSSQSTLHRFAALQRTCNGHARCGSLSAILAYPDLLQVLGSRLNAVYVAATRAIAGPLPPGEAGAEWRRLQTIRVTHSILRRLQPISRGLP